MECYRRAEQHWDRRDAVRARSEGPWKRGVGLASQIWYGGGGPPSYAWVRVGSDGRATVVTAMQDIGTGTATAMSQIAAEELGLPLDSVEFVFGDSARGPYASVSAGSSTIPSMGPAVRSAAADAARQIVEIAAQRYDKEERVLSLSGGNVVSADGGSWPIEEVVGLLEDAQILGKGARGPNPTGMQVFTFGVQVAEVAVDVETGEIRVERVAAIHDVGRVINPLGASSQVEGGIIQGIGHTLSEDRLLDPETGLTLNPTLDAYKLPTIADVPEIVTELARHSRRAPDEPRLEGPRRAADRADRRGDRERDPRRDRRGRHVAPDHARGDAARAARGERAREGGAVELLRPSSRRGARGARQRRRPAAAGRSSCRCSATGSSRPRRSSTCARSSRGASTARASARARRSASSRSTRRSRRRCARRAASPRRPQLRNDGLDRRQPAAGDALLVLAPQVPVPPARRRPLPRARGPAPRARDLRERATARRRIRPTSRRRCSRSEPRVRTTARELPVAELYRLPTEDDRSSTTLEPDELILELDVPRAGHERLPQGDGPPALVVPDRRRRRGALRRRACASASPARRRSRGCSTRPEALADATPLPGTAYKVEIAEALVRRALEAIA